MVALLASLIVLRMSYLLLIYKPDHSSLTIPSQLLYFGITSRLIVPFVGIYNNITTLTLIPDDITLQNATLIIHHLHTYQGSSSFLYHHH